MSDKPTYEQLEGRIAALEAENKNLRDMLVQIATHPAQPFTVAPVPYPVPAPVPGIQPNPFDPTPWQPNWPFPGGTIIVGQTDAAATFTAADLSVPGGVSIVGQPIQGYNPNTTGCASAWPQ